MCLGFSYTAEAATLTTDSTSTFIDQFKKEHPNWTITPVNQDTATQLKRMTTEQYLTAGTTGSAPPVTDLYIDQVGWALGTPEAQVQYIYNDLTSQPVYGITGVAVVKMGYGSTNQWLDEKQILYGDPSYVIDSSFIDVNGDTIVDGFFDVVYFDSDEKIPSGYSAKYRYQSTSFNYPRNTINTFINIPHQ